ncbi:alanine racemase [Microbacterium halotolerans]|uniref:alanine racemase n=1 Tax=Microbacterium halotolerans TaxID=246613 RepID=UPI000E6AB316|nr:alanine racemase [Microbacterium halotolerans]
MFLNNLISQNPAFARAAIELHQSGELPPDTYVIDLDTLAENAKMMTTEAHRLGLDVVAMTKQFGRNPDAIRTLKNNGVDSFVAVDLEGARAIHRVRQPLGNVGHLVQIPKHAAEEVAAMEPQSWTVFSDGKAQEVADATLAQFGGHGHSQGLLARIFGPDDEVVESHAGGYDVTEILKIADRFDGLGTAHFNGVTSYPALMFDKVKHTVHPTPNLRTLQQAAETLRKAGRADVVINGPGETSTNVMSTLASHGVTQVEPGHGFTATGGYHAFGNLPERPAMLYLSEVSHLDGDFGFCFGGGLYLCIGSIEYQPQAIVGRDFDTAVTQKVNATLAQNHQVIDFYGRLAQTERRSLAPGDSALFCFRAQAFYVRSHIAGVSGIHTGKAKVEGIYTSSGRPL